MSGLTCSTKSFIKNGFQGKELREAVEPKNCGVPGLRSPGPLVAPESRNIGSHGWVQITHKAGVCDSGTSQ